MTETSATPQPRLTGRTPLSAGALGFAAMMAAGFWVLVSLAFHWIRSDLDPCCSSVSNYARGDYEWLMQAAFVVFGFGWMAAGIAVARALHGVRGAALMRGALLVAGLGLLLSGMFRTDDLGGTDGPSAEHVVHTVGSLLAFGGLIVYGLVAASAMRRSPDWKSLAVPHLMLGLATLALVLTFSIWVETIGDGFGWWQRALTMVLMPAWLALLGWRLERTARTYSA
ncbi:DUF998 domain-containing protein [Demequina activiva]|uniref:DUF998 domain-containing protein n=1 Tax=Demequina activiva TaxID=1582364 RepID=A0A919UFU7_9MICO|nr:DUF998 domain-containing protein [Demequina activiva]GIG53814.1 hypothetical protein Dac01nite_05660 [Demequina activiva]